MCVSVFVGSITHTANNTQQPTPLHLTRSDPVISEILRRVWDGIGGILKGYLRRVNVRFLAWNPDVDDPERNPVLCDDGRIRTAEHVYQQLERSFGSAAWRLKAEEKTRAISHFSFKFMTTRDIVRPTSQVIYERIKGISRSYQYLMIKEDDVLGRGSTGTASPPRSARRAGAGGLPAVSSASTCCSGPTTRTRTAT